MAAEDCRGGGRRRFAAACGVLSRCVRAEAAAAETAASYARRAALPAAPPVTMLLMPGADVAPDVAAAAVLAGAPAPPAPLKITYGERVLVFDDLPAGTAAELMRVAGLEGVTMPDVVGSARGGPAAAGLQVASRKASVRRHMEKRRDRLAAAAARPAPAVPP